MTIHRVRVFDQSASIRALLSRELGSRAHLACIDSSPHSAIYESCLDDRGADAFVIGLDRRQGRPRPELFAEVARSEVPTVFLYPPGRPDRPDFPFPHHWLALEKPRNTQGWEALCSTLVTVLEGMQIAAEGGEKRKGASFVRWGLGSSRVDLIAIGGSAGGPDATGIMLKTIGIALQNATVLVVQHIGEGFEADYVQWMSRLLPWADVKIAIDGEAVDPGQVWIAGPGSHLEIVKGPSLRLDRHSPPEHGHRPSIDRLFKSVARTKPENSTGILLSGMGIDGVEGLQQLNKAGCLTMVQDRESCAVFGMPRVALERGAAAIAEPPEELGRVLRNMIEVGRPQ